MAPLRFIQSLPWLTLTTATLCLSRSSSRKCPTHQKNCWKVFKKKHCHNSPVYGTCHRSQNYACAKTRQQSVGHDFKKNVLTCEQMKLMVGKDKCVTCIPGSWNMKLGHFSTAPDGAQYLSAEVSASSGGGASGKAEVEGSSLLAAN